MVGFYSAGRDGEGPAELTDAEELSQVRIMNEVT